MAECQTFSPPEKWRIGTCKTINDSHFRFHSQPTEILQKKALALKPTLRCSIRNMIKIFWSKAGMCAALAGVVLFPQASRTCAQTVDNSQTSKQEPPLACNPSELSQLERDRHFGELIPALKSLRKSVRELNDGYEFEFPGDRTTLQLLAEWAIQERQCCPFFEISLVFEPERGSALLRLTGRNGTKDFMKTAAATFLEE
jgi:hypothetical protein